jgi:hypothetical protein
MLRFCQLLLLALLPALGTASPAVALNAKTALRPVGEFSLHRVGVERSQLPDLPQESALGYGENASDSPLASRAGEALAERAGEIHSALHPIAQEMRTTAVLETNGGRIVAGGGPDLTPAQRALLGAGETLARLPGAHAEVTALTHAAETGLTPGDRGNQEHLPDLPECDRSEWRNADKSQTAVRP